MATQSRTASEIVQGRAGAAAGAVAGGAGRVVKPVVGRLGRATAFGTLAGLAVAAWLYASPGVSAEKAFVIPPPAVDMADLPTAGAANPAIASPAVPVPADGQQFAVFAGGCFWGVQAVFQHTRGVLQAVSGYAGGTADTARYDLVSHGATDHAEAVLVTFDPAQVTYGQLLHVFFSVIHDPTQLNRQGPDTGRHYRSALFPADDAQEAVATRYIAQLDAAQVYPARIVTRLEPLSGFYPAEAYHQDYATRHPDQPYIAIFDLPKIAHLERLFPDFFRKEPNLVDPANARPRH